MLEVHISKHSLFRLKITVGCLTSTYPCIHVETPSRSRSVACGAYPNIHFSLDEDTLKMTVGCLVLCCGVLCGGVVLCGVLWCVVKLGTLSLSLSCSFSYSCSCSFSLSLLSSFLPSSLFSSLPFTPTNTVQSTDQQTRRPTLRRLNVIWRRASAQQSVLSLLLSPPSSLLPLPSSEKKRGLFLLQEYFGRGNYLKLLHVNSKTIGL